jgi:hypothetical protein
MRTALLWLTVGVLAFAGTTGGQTLSKEEPPPVPEGEGAWTIRVTTSGGLTGRGRGNVTLTSQRALTCSQTLRACDNLLAADKFQPVARLVSSFSPSKWAGPTARENIMCNDCFTTTVLFVRRAGGKLNSATISWNDVTQTKAPPDVVRIAEMALSGKW